MELEIGSRIQDASADNSFELAVGELYSALNELRGVFLSMLAAINRDNKILSLAEVMRQRVLNAGNFVGRLGLANEHENVKWSLTYGLDAELLFRSRVPCTLVGAQSIYERVSFLKSTDLDFHERGLVEHQSVDRHGVYDSFCVPQMQLIHPDGSSLNCLYHPDEAGDFMSFVTEEIRGEVNFSCRRDPNFPNAENLPFARCSITPDSEVPNVIELLDRSLTGVSTHKLGLYDWRSLLIDRVNIDGSLDLKRRTVEPEKVCVALQKCARDIILTADFLESEGLRVRAIRSTQILFHIQLPCLIR